jgi:tRNA(adenine34) deaminase
MQLKRQRDMEDEEFMRAALKNAQIAFEQGEVPVGAVLVYQGNIIAEGYNLVEKNQNATCHAEMQCILEAQKKLSNWRLSECTLYTTLEPCLMCYGAAILARVKKIVYGANDFRHGACGGCFHLHENDHPIHKIDLVGQVLAEESAGLLKSFFKKVRDEKRRD